MGLQDVSSDLGGRAPPNFTKWTTTPIASSFNTQRTTAWRCVAGKPTNQQGLDEVAAALTEADVAFEWADQLLISKRRVQNLLSFTDPAGNQHEAYWGVVSDFKAFTPLKASPGFVTADQGLGHVVLPCA